MVWWINKHKLKHSISIVHIFCVVSFKAFCKFLRLRNSAWDFWGVNFWSRDIWGGVGLLEALGISLGFEIQSISSLGGRESLLTRGTCLTITNIHAWPMRWASFWGRRVIGAWVYSRKYSNCLKCGNVNIKVLYMIH